MKALYTPGLAVYFRLNDSVLFTYFHTADNHENTEQFHHYEYRQAAVKQLYYHREEISLDTCAKVRESVKNPRYAACKRPASLVNGMKPENSVYSVECKSRKEDSHQYRLGVPYHRECYDQSSAYCRHGCNNHSLVVEHFRSCKPCYGKGAESHTYRKCQTGKTFADNTRSVLIVVIKRYPVE